MKAVWIAALIGALAAAGTAFPAGRAPAPALLLPDLDQRAPFVLLVTTAEEQGGTHFLLGFASAVENVGEGPLVVEGHRPSTTKRTMQADQVVRLTDGSTRTIRRVGELRYVVSPSHKHWHLRWFDRYTLRRADDFSAVVRDQKTGFCLGDRYPTTRSAPPARFTRRCGRGSPELLRVVEGISPGFGDLYAPVLEGQSLDVTGLPAGRYELVHRVNADRRLRESDYANNAASALVDLSWPGGPAAKPRVEVLRSCEDSSRCDPEPEARS